jgi:signal transduction histidine kinase
VNYALDRGAGGIAEKRRLEAADTGIGLSPEEAVRLSIVKRLAQLYGGDVSVQSEPDVGSRFAVTLGLKAGARN